MVLASAIFSPQWSGKVIQFKIDNAAVIQVIEATCAQNAHLMYLLRLFFTSYHDLWFTASHIAISSIPVQMPYQEIIWLCFSYRSQAQARIPSKSQFTCVSQPDMDIYSLDDTLHGCYSVALATSAHKYKATE